MANPRREVLRHDEITQGQLLWLVYFYDGEHRYWYVQEHPSMDDEGIEFNSLHEAEEYYNSRLLELQLNNDVLDLLD